MVQGLGGFRYVLVVVALSTFVVDCVQTALVRHNGPEGVAKGGVPDASQISINIGLPGGTPNLNPVEDLVNRANHIAKVIYFAHMFCEGFIL